jgi:hypothetical protein
LPEALGAGLRVFLPSEKPNFQHNVPNIAFLSEEQSGVADSLHGHAEVHVVIVGGTVLVSLVLDGLDQSLLQGEAVRCRVAHDGHVVYEE